MSIEPSSHISLRTLDSAVTRAKTYPALREDVCRRVLPYLLSDRVPPHANIMSRDMFALPVDVFGGNGANLIDMWRSSLNNVLGREDSVIKVGGSLTYLVKNGTPDWKNIGDIDLMVYIPDALEYDNLPYFNNFTGTFDLEAKIGALFCDMAAYNGISAHQHLADHMMLEYDTFVTSTTLNKGYLIDGDIYHLSDLRSPKSDKPSYYQSYYDPFSYYDQQERTTQVTEQISFRDLADHFMKQYNYLYEFFYAREQAAADTKSDPKMDVLHYPEYYPGVCMFKTLAYMFRLRGNYFQAGVAQENYRRFTLDVINASHSAYGSRYFNSREDRAKISRITLNTAEEMRRNNGISPAEVGIDRLRYEISARLWTHYLQAPLTPEAVAFIESETEE